MQLHILHATSLKYLINSTQDPIQSAHYTVWLCTPFAQLWSEARGKLSEILNLGIPLNPLISLLEDLCSLPIPHIFKLLF